MTRSNHIFIDFENVNETELERITGKPVCVTFVLGDRHKMVPTIIAKMMQDHPNQVKVAQNSLPGKNALDMVLAMHVGMKAKTDPDGYIHIVAKDRGYQALIIHLKELGRLAAQHDSLSKIPLLMNQKEKLTHLREKYTSPTFSRPGDKKALGAQIQHLFAHSVSEREMQALIHGLEHAKIIKITNDHRVTFVHPQGTLAKAA